MKLYGPSTFVVTLFRCLVLCLITCAESALAAQSASTMRLEVDAREISRKLLHAREEIPVQPGKLALWYPKWMPGTHSPGGPVQNIAGLRVETQAGQPIAWRRDETEPYRIECTVPDGVDRMVVRLGYICNQPTVNSEGVDSFGNAYLGLINWNTCLLYPEGPTASTIFASVLRCPGRFQPLV